jgi:YggT family protein
MLFGRILISWFPDFQDNKLVQFVSYYTDPYLNLFRKIIPPFGMLDISPIFAFLGLGVIEYVVLAILKGFLR